MAALASMLPVQGAAAQDVPAAIQKANLYIEVAKLTERAADSWDRYASWVNMKTGPTGKERYISYGMYELHDVGRLLKKARGAAGLKPSTPKLDTTMKRYMDAYEALAPVMTRANDYYERKGYQADGMAEGRALHARMVPLANAFLSERETMLRELRAFVRDVEQQEVAAIEAREGRSRAWQAAQVMHAANRVVDLFPRTRPTPIDSDTLEEKLRAIGPNTPGEKLDEIIVGVVRPAGVIIDVKRLDAAIKVYAAAVEVFDRFAAEKPEGLEDVKDLPRHLLNGLRALQEPLARSQGHDFDGSGPLVGRVVQDYFALLSASSSVSGSELRFLQ
jgi:hypothetical protein